MSRSLSQWFWTGPFITLIFIATSLQAQNKKLTHEDYDSWWSIQGIETTDDGAWIAWERGPHRGDGQVIYQRLDGSDPDTLYRATAPSFSSGGRFLLVKVEPVYEELRRARLKKVKKEEQPKPALVILDLRSGAIDTIHRIKSFDHPSEGMEWVAVLLEKELSKKEETKDSTETGEQKGSKDNGVWLVPPTSAGKKKEKEKGDRLMIRPMGDSTTFILRGVRSYRIPKQGEDVFLIREEIDSLNPSGVFRFDLNSRELVPMDTSGEDYSQLSMDETGKHVSWLVTNDTIKDKEKHRWIMRGLRDGASFSLDSNSQGLPQGWRISPFASARFSELGDRMWVQLQPKPRKFGEDTTLLDDEKVKVDIWSWKDDLIQPMQLKNKKRELERGFWASVDSKAKRLTPLENENLEIAGFDLDHLTDWLPAYDETPYRKRLSWDYPTYNDLYVVSTRTGKARKITERVQARPQVSPGGKYVYWYDNVLQQWKVQDIDGGEIRILSVNIPHPVFDVENDIPAPAYPYGISGWSQKDRFVLIYDRFDIWKVDPSNLKAVRLTHGREENGRTQYRRVDLDREDPFLKKDKWLLLGFNEGTKDQSLVWMDPNSGDMTLWDQGEIRYRTIQKVKNGDVFVIRKENFVSYPEIYVAGGPREELKRLSTTNPQQAEFNWGTVEKVTWTAFDGTPLEGLLYKPEDFDPTKKYPMMVYFYETYSDNLHVHYTPRPSASVINFPLFVSNGYLIFVPDIVYKVGEPGPSAYNCIVSGTREMMKHSWVDSTRIGIQGQSWGGYQVAYLVTQTDLYAAAMAGAPVSNMLSAYGGIRWGSGMSREFQYEKTQSRLGTTPWDNLDVYLKNSPVVYADQVNTPLLIMHNDNDGAVPWYQGIEYFMALRRLHKPAWMLVYNNEEHNLMLDHNRKDLSRRMSQFFDHYLKDAPTPEWMDEGVPATEKGKNYGFEYLSKPSEE